METSREPDVYVKTVLTFGDEPARAMAQIALRKNAEQKRFVFRSCPDIEEPCLHGQDL